MKRPKINLKRICKSKFKLADQFGLENIPKMYRRLILVCLFPLLGCGQSSEVQTKSDLVKIYTQALGDFIKTANKNNGKVFDTLFVGKRKFGQKDDFPDIKLPNVIEKAQIRLITPEEGEKTQNAVKTRIYINIFGWVNKKNAEFKFFVFSNGFAHQYNYSLNYNYNATTRKYDLIKSEFIGPPFDK